MGEIKIFIDFFLLLWVNNLKIISLKVEENYGKDTLESPQF